MNRAVTVLFCALEALLVVGIGVGISLVPLSLLWAFEFGLQVDWMVFWRVASDAWLVGHGVDVHVSLAGDSVAQLGVESLPAFDVTIAALGFALVTLLLSVRAGGRIVASRHWRLGSVVAVTVFAALAFAVAASATHEVAAPAPVQSVVLPTAVFAAGLAVGAARGARDRESRGAGARTAVSDLVQRIPLDVRVVGGAALRGGAAAVTAVLLVSALACAVLIGVHYAEIVALYESAHTGALGGVAVTLGQLAIAPNLVVWAAAWFVGPGFALGAGSSVSPLATSVGTVPVVPVLGAVPVETGAWGFVGILVPVLAGFVAGVVVRAALVRVTGALSPMITHVVTGLGIGIAGGALLGVLAAASAGSAGPGRLAVVGPDPLLVGLWAALEFGVAATIGVLVGGRSRDD